MHNYIKVTLNQILLLTLTIYQVKCIQKAFTAHHLFHILERKKKNQNFHKITHHTAINV